MKLSIIIPVYNAVDYLDRCLTSIGVDHNPSVEIIAVNDGSLDGSLAMLSALAKQDPRIIVIDQPNSGVSVARNHGLTVATGDYVTFLDADDYYLSPIYNQVFQLLRDTPAVDLMIFGYQRKFGKLDRDIKTFSHSDVIDQQVFNQRFAEYYGSSLLSSACNKIYSLELLKQHGLKFSQGLKIGEDLMFNLGVFAQCQTIIVSEHVLYAYEVGNLNSVTKNRGKDEWLNQLSLLEQVENYRTRYDGVMTPNYQRMMENVILSSLVLTVQNGEGYGVIKQIIHEPRIQHYCAVLGSFKSKSSLVRWMILKRWSLVVYCILGLRRILKKSS